MTGRTVMITGGNSGIGFETAVALATAGATTVIGARDSGRGHAAVDAIRERSGSDDVSLVVFDLATLSSVAAGAATILERCPCLDVLINNAGVVQAKRRLTDDGFEATFAINHLGHFFLTQLLIERIKASAPARIINVSSVAHRSARLDFDDLQSARAYSGMGAYARSKLANVLFTTELARRLAGTGVTVNSLHPGVVRTGWGRDGDLRGFFALGVAISHPFMLTPRRGARTSVYLASSPDVAGVTGQYFVRGRAQRLTPNAADPLAAHLLWEHSEQLIAAATAKDPSRSRDPLV